MCAWIDAAAYLQPLRQYRAVMRAEDRVVKSICSVMFPKSLPIVDRFRQAKNAGFDAIEVRYGDEIASDAHPMESAQSAMRRRRLE